MSERVRMDRAACSLCLAVLACSPFPSPSGIAVRVVILDESRLRTDDGIVDWDEFFERVSAMVETAQRGEGDMPHVQIGASKAVAGRLGDRLLQRLQDAGVRAVSFGQ